MPVTAKVYFLIIIFLLSYGTVRATHIVGGEVTYEYLKDTSMGGVFKQKYRVSLTIYEDCIVGEGDPGAISQDNPAFLGVFTPGGSVVQIDTNIAYSFAEAVPINFSNNCISNIPPACLIKKTFIKDYYLPHSVLGYVIAYQRCCRNSSIANIRDPGSHGATYYCSIPSSLKAPNNSSAIFKNYPPQIICINNPLVYDNSATDVDGDSLSYAFCATLSGADGGNSKPIPLPPDFSVSPYYDSVQYLSPYSAQSPMPGFPSIRINPVTGMITGTPNLKGRFLVTVCCNEWRHGILINTVQREFQFVVTDCSKVVVADIPQLPDEPNTYIVNCTDYKVKFENTSSGGFAYSWDFGVPGADNDTSSEFEPVFTYPDTGTYTVKLIVNPSSTCPDSVIRLVKVYPKFLAAFADSGVQCPGQPIFFKDNSVSTIKPITAWSWNFGDNTPIVTEQSPQHTYQHGGTYNVVLASGNAKGCTDTAIRHVLIESFKPFAGNDTIIVKGEYILFNAKGGSQYSWSPATMLNSTDVYDPVGTYPDTGRYVYGVHVISDYGCSGDDTIQVQVVNQASFVVPTAFTPNGDGRNDDFRPIAVGYRNLKYFRVFDRWGEEVYYGTSLEVGWDGNYKGRKAEMGTYFWEICYTDRLGKNGFMKGDVTLVR